jgi:predicted PurR-regulated permease PerM
VVAAIGFELADVAAVPLLSVLVFVLSLIPLGRPLSGAARPSGCSRTARWAEHLYAGVGFFLISGSNSSRKTACATWAD